MPRRSTTRHVTIPIGHGLDFVLDLLPLPDRVRLGATCKALRTSVAEYNAARPDRSCMLMQRGSLELAVDMIKRIDETSRLKRKDRARRLGAFHQETGVFINVHPEHYYMSLKNERMMCIEYDATTNLPTVMSRSPLVTAAWDYYTLEVGIGACRPFKRVARAESKKKVEWTLGHCYMPSFTVEDAIEAARWMRWAYPTTTLVLRRQPAVFVTLDPPGYSGYIRLQQGQCEDVELKRLLDAGYRLGPLKPVKMYA